MPDSPSAGHEAEVYRAAIARHGLEAAGRAALEDALANVPLLKPNTVFGPHLLDRIARAADHA